MNKITKLLSVFVIAGAVGASVAGVAGCKGNDGGGDEGGHTHNYTQCAPDTEHPGKHILTCEGCEAGTEGHTKTEDCVDAKINDTGAAGEDGLCDKCGADMPGESEDPSKVKTITVSTEDGKTANVECKAGKSIQLKATVAPGTATEQGVTWSLHADSESKATITQEGLLTIKSDLAADSTVTVYATTKEAGSSIKGTLTVNALVATRFDTLSADTENNILSKDFEATETISEFSGTYGTKGIYSKIKTAGKGDIVVEGGKLKQNVSSNGDTQIVVDFGTVKDVVEGYVEVILEGGSGWTMFRLLGTDGRLDTDGTTFKVDEVFGLRWQNTNLNYRLGGGAAVPGAGGDAYASNGIAPENVLSASNGVLPVYFKYNKQAQSLTVKVGTGENVYLENEITEISSFVGLSFASSSDGTKKVQVDNLAVNTYDVTAAEITGAIEGYKAVVEKISKEADALKGAAWTGTNTETSLTNAKTAVDFTNATTFEAAKTVYETYKTTVLGVLTDEYVARLQAKYLASNYTTGTEDVDDDDSNLKKYNDALAKANTDLGAVKSVQGFADVYKELDENVFANIPTDSLLLKAKVTVEIYNGATKIGTYNGKDGGVVTADELTAVCTVETGYKIVGYYKVLTGDVLSEAVDFGTNGFALVADGTEGNKTDTTLNLYVEVATFKQSTITVSESKPSTTGDAGVTVTANCSFNAGDFKFASSSENVILTIAGAKKGQIITLTLEGYTGSGGNAAGLDATPTNVSDTTVQHVDFSATSKIDAQEKGVFTFTVAEDGNVTITLARNPGKTARLTKVIVEVIGDGETGTDTGETGGTEGSEGTDTGESGTGTGNETEPAA